MTIKKNDIVVKPSNNKDKDNTSDNQKNDIVVKPSNNNDKANTSDKVKLVNNDKISATTTTTY